ncbi:MAG TPA: glycosyltransferase family 4 protein [Bacteroidales bacterium]|nr:glycosyltransferase family 4 protein [Bacteroidales bacterium]HOR82508.1 glycosyltransferase family 4 protein [Bacteroidales bacterium]HPJ92193.1 glycosyltransferase family 4 protein [Bacteroidales bacterium]
MKEKLKVVWLCHFSNNEINALFHSNHNEFSPWINLLLSLFEKRQNIELYVVAPNIFVNADTVFIKNGIHYHFYSFYKKYIPFVFYRIYNRFFPSEYRNIQVKIYKIIKQINPDIIHLHGAENPYYSIGIINLIEEFPTLLTIQGFAMNSSLRNRKISKCIQIENKIISLMKNIAVRTIEMEKIVLTINPNATIFHHNYAVTIPTVQKETNATYDIIYFARITKDKGLEDLLKAVAMVKKEKSDITLHIIGNGNKSFQKYLLNLVKKLDIEANVVWVGFLKNQQDVFNYVVKAKICVLPTYHDVIPGTIIESMFMKIPVIAYAVGGIPELNETNQNILLVEKNNISELAHNILQLIKNPLMQEELGENAFNYIRKKVDNEKVVDDIIQIYQTILNNV